MRHKSSVQPEPSDISVALKTAVSNVRILGIEVFALHLIWQLAVLKMFWDACWLDQKTAVTVNSIIQLSIIRHTHEWKNPSYLQNVIKPHRHNRILALRNQWIFNWKEQKIEQ